MSQVHANTQGSVLSHLRDLPPRIGIKVPSKEEQGGADSAGSKDLAAFLSSAVQSSTSGVARQSLFKDDNKDSGSGMNAQSASGALGAFLHSKEKPLGEIGGAKLDVNDLYQISQGSFHGQSVPPTVQDAAKFMLQNPDAYKQIET